MNWYMKVLTNYVNFTGRASRKEYWYFILFHIIFLIVFSFIEGLIGLKFSGSPYGAISSVYMLALFLPSIAVAVRRTHDSGRSGWHLLASFIPFIGSLWVIYLMIASGTEGDNAYGSKPSNFP